jgi:hypothetical protein
MDMSFFSFPNPVNDVAARTVATGVITMAIVCLATGQMWIIIFLAYGFIARVLAGPRISPLGQIATRFVAPKLSTFEKLVPGPPKRFAQGIGALFTSSAMLLWLVGETTAARVLLVLLCIPALLEAGLGYCVGCKMFAIFMRLGIIPESVCLECANIYSERARQRPVGKVN